MTTEIEPFVAAEDITCYKVINRKTQGDVVKYFGVYRRKFEYKFDEVLTSPLVLKEELVYDAFHTLMELDDLEFMVNLVNAYGFKDFDPYTVKCTIPKGAKYYKGAFSLTFGYASDQLIMHSETIEK